MKKKKSFEQILKEVEMGTKDIKLPLSIKISRFLGFTTGIFLLLLIIFGLAALIKLCYIYLFGG